MTTSTGKGRILVLDDEPDVCVLLERGLGRRGYHVETSCRSSDALAKLDAAPFDCLLVDLRLGSEDGLEACKIAVARHPTLSVVVLTGYGSMDAAVGAIRAGAYDFTTKPIDLESLDLLLARAVHYSRLESEVRRLRLEVHTRGEGATGLIGDSPVMRKLLGMLERIADSDAAVLVTGESGTGKELVARALHRTSPRRDAPFLAVNCAALPENLLESELFGHARGAFTDAKRSRQGLFVEAGHGTLFLDEIAELPLELQPKLLRALQERKVRPVGESHEVEVHARIVAATNRDLEHEVEEGRFREDLFYRVNVIRLHVPPLTRRGNDVLLLSQHFLERIAARTGKSIVGLTPEAAQKLLAYDWPGNVRELENAMERAIALARYDRITLDDLPDRIREHQSDRIVLADTAEHLPTLQQLERRYLEHVLKLAGGNKTQAAQLLGLDRRTLYRKLERYARDDE